MHHARLRCRVGDSYSVYVSLAPLLKPIDGASVDRYVAGPGPPNTGSTIQYRYSLLPVFPSPGGTPPPIHMSSGVTSGANSSVKTKKTPGGAGTRGTRTGHATRAHKGTRTTQTNLTKNLTTIQTHQQRHTYPARQRDDQSRGKLNSHRPGADRSPRYEAPRARRRRVYRLAAPGSAARAPDKQNSNGSFRAVLTFSAGKEYFKVVAVTR